MADIVTAPPKDRTDVTQRETTRGRQFTPRVDIYETDKELTLCAEMPGVRPDGVDLRYENGELALHGRVKKQDPGGERQYLIQEYEDGDFHRVFSIHESIDASRIAAECKNGVLTVHLPKVEAVRPRQIAVRGQ